MVEVARPIAVTTPMFATFKVCGRDADDIYVRATKQAQDLAGDRPWFILNLDVEPHLTTDALVISWEATVQVKVMGG